MAAPTSLVNIDVVLAEGADLAPVVGSFTIDGLTYAVTDEGAVELVAISDEAAEDDAVSDLEDTQQMTEPAESEDAPAALELPASVSYEGASYSLVSIAPYAFHLSSVERVAIPASVAFIDERAFRSCAVSWVEVAEGSPEYESFDGALYGAGLIRLLSIPGGRVGAVRILSQTEEVPASAFSHCAGVAAVSVDAGSAAFSSWDDCLYDASGETLLRVPAGAADITIRDGCTAIAAGAMEGCAKLESITAPATVSSISPYAFSQEPETVSLPAASLADGEGVEEPEGALGSEVPTSPRPPSGSSMRTAEGVQLSSTVALTASDDSLPEVDPASIEVVLPAGADGAPWQRAGLSVLGADALDGAPTASGQVVVDAQAAGNLGADAYYNSWQDYYMPYNYGALASEPLTIYGQYRDEAAPSYIHVLAPQADGFYLRVVGSFTGDTVQESYVRHEGGRWLIERVDATPGRSFITWIGADVASLSLTPTGPSLEVGASVRGKTVFFRTKCNVVWDAAGGSCERSVDAVEPGGSVIAPIPVRAGYRFLGWEAEAPEDDPSLGPVSCAGGASTGPVYSHYLYKARWGYGLSFDTGSEPGDEGYPGDAIDDKVVDADDGTIAVEPPTRPGYVFQGWVVEGKPNDEGLLTEGEDGTWSVDASKLPDYADGNGKVNLTARWTAAISVDAPISATFMYDLSAWDGAESRDAMTVEGSSTVRNRSAIPIRVSGLESETGSAANVLKKDDGTTLADAEKGDAAKVLSVFPTTSETTGTESDAKGGASDDAGDDLAHKVDLALSEVKLEEAFDADAWAIPAGASANGAVTAPGEAKLGYRLNLGSSTGVTLDKNALLAATGDPEAGSSSKVASIADLTYCFALEGLVPTGSADDVLWVENDDPALGTVGIYGTADLELAAEALSKAEASGEGWQETSLWYRLLHGLMEADDGTGEPYGHVKWGDGITYGVRIIGINHDDRSDGTGKAGLTFQFVDCLNAPRSFNDLYGGGWANYTSFYMGYGSWSGKATNAGGWGASRLRADMNPGPAGRLPDGSFDTAKSTGVASGADTDAVWAQVPGRLRAALTQVSKGYYADGALRASDDWLFVPSVPEAVSKNIPSCYPEGVLEEGSCYEFFKRGDTDGSTRSTPNDSLTKWHIKPDGARETTTFWTGLGVVPGYTWMWLLRTTELEIGIVAPDGTTVPNGVAIIEPVGSLSQVYTPCLMGLSPAFCL